MTARELNLLADKWEQRWNGGAPNKRDHSIAPAQDIFDGKYLNDAGLDCLLCQPDERSAA